MDEEVKARILAMLDGVESSASQAGQFVLDQAPLAAQEYVAYCYWSSLMGVVASAIAVVLALVLVVGALRRVLRGVHNEPEVAIVIGSLFCALISGMLGGVGLVDNTQTLIKASCAPRVLLLEKASELAGLGHVEK